MDFVAVAGTVAVLAVAGVALWVRAQLRRANAKWPGGSPPPNFIEQVRAYREKHGVGLKEAKDAVEAQLLGQPTPLRDEKAILSASEEVAALVRAGKKLEAIKRYREQTGMGLAEAKAAVDALARR